MGNSSKKLAAKCTILTKDEQKYVGATFRSASKNSDKLREDDLIVSGTVDAELLEKFWGPQIDPRLAQYLSNFLFGWGPNKSATASFNRFAELYVFNVRGSLDKKLMLTYNSLGMEYSDTAEVPYQLFKEYCESIVSTYIKILKSSDSKRAKAWVKKGFRGKAAVLQVLGEAVASGAANDIDSPPHSYTAQDIGQMLCTDVLLGHMLEMVFTTLFGFTREIQDSSDDGTSIVPPMLPAVEGLESMPDYPAFIDLAHIVWLNSHIPQQHQHRWRFLFSSHIHGESFSTLAGRIQDQGASILIIEDNSGYIFGGYATESWELNPTFTGGEESFLFTLAPKFRIYHSTGFNDHYQYINHHTKTLPNGLLMGGQFEFGGIWVNADPFGQGSSAESCSTYRNYKRLSKEANFTIRSLEVWAVGDKPLTAKESDERDVSVLDVNPEAKAILELAGRTRHSDGIREPPPL